MVWAIKFPLEFNEFFPRGAFRGYREALAAHYKAEREPGLTPKHPPYYVFRSERPVDGDGTPYRGFQDYEYDVSEKFHHELGVRRPHHPPLGPVQPHGWPPEYVFERVYKRDAATVKLPDRKYAVTEPLRQIIERLEPGVHHFNPIRVWLPKGGEHPVPHHMMVVGRWLNGFRLEESDPTCLRDIESISPVVRSDTKDCFAGVAISAPATAGAHLWCERTLRGATFYLSDRLKDEILQAGLRLPQSFKMKSV
jgi:hypothetical protein